MKALVTGAAGFIGSHLVEVLLQRGDEVRALVRPDEDTWRLQPFSRVEIFQGDMTDTATLKGAVQGVERVYHIAAKTGPWGMEQTYRAINEQGLSDLVYAAMEAGARRIVHTSSITVYGHHLRGIVTEDHPYHAENNPYSRTKIAGEKLLFNLVKQKGAPVVIVRPAWVYGPRDSTSFSRFVSLVESGKGFIIGTGKNVVPIVYVRDVVQGLIKAGDAGDHVVGRAYTLADDRRVTQLEYLNTIADTLKAPHVARKLPFLATYMAGRTAEIVWQVVDPRRMKPPPLTTYGVTLLGGDQQFSIEKARRELGYAPEFDVKLGVAEGVRWYLSAKQSS
ncbi:MAG TPA: NAD-dependent epimerase/dehydratase family protein [Ktedonobacteraceae bacterium]|nr:NAD-dependent epimerase/dehydratase family protein [Ktedonobacteraceae bacterium]